METSKIINLLSSLKTASFLSLAVVVNVYWPHAKDVPCTGKILTVHLRKCLHVTENETAAMKDC